VAVCAAVGAGLWVFSRATVDVDAQLAAIDAAHAVPPGENTADDWGALVRDTGMPQPDSQSLPPEVLTLTMSRPWRNDDQPQAAKWLQDKQTVMNAILRIADKPKCWFPVSDVNRPEQDYFSMELQGTILMMQAVNNDLGEDRLESALEKLFAVLRIASQLSSQTHGAEYLAGRSIGDMVTERTIWVVANYHVPDSWLAKFEAEMTAIDDASGERLREYSKITSLSMRRNDHDGSRLVQTLIGPLPGRADAGLPGSQGMLGRLRGCRIMLALRRHKNATGVWPQSLSEIQAGLPSKALVDPLSKRPFCLSTRSRLLRSLWRRIERHR
jgi:hypothetical protein